MMAANGMDQARIARVIGGGMAVNTLAKHFRDELDMAAIKAEAKMGGAAFNKGINGDNQMIRYWLNCRAGWTEKSTVEHTGQVSFTTIFEQKPK